MNPFRQYFMILFEWISLWLRYGLTRLWRDFPVVNTWIASPGITDRRSCQEDSEEWKTNEALRTYHLGDGSETMVTVQTSTHAFHADLRRLSECSEYFRALSQSKMRETSESLIHLDHVSSSVFYNLLEFSFHNKFGVPQEELGTHIQEICCAELKMTVFSYLSRNLMELSLLTRCLNDEEKDEVVNMRIQGDRHLCTLRKENLTTWNDPETERARHIFILNGSEDSEDWHPVTELPFRADKWCFTTVVLYNYLYIIGGYRHRARRGLEFKMASFRYNPFTHTWVSTAPLIKHRRHFSAVACEGCIYAVGGWYLDSLVSPDSSTALYTAVECYDPWEDAWRFVSSLPLTDFQFTVSLSHDVPLATSLGHCLYVLGSIQRTGEKLLLQYNTQQDSWSELLPTLTRADADLPTLYFLGVTDRLLVIGGNNSENVVTSFCVQSQKWGEVRRAEKVAFAGQGTVADDEVLMPSIEHNTVAKLDLQTLSLRAFPPLPVSARYEAVFYLHF
ncbi:kelch repeat and BTB domain-containing protein 13 isoform X1 [Xiphias gladius]|uniref:kelch repeat and BTB domain-containing protein 13 isoform X1 n=1 Tax=Xiphias gladius TaxID=8245 RepID=UPI001A985D23|nr:kelch repeat and BTB domain-containing protein 13 isoform X1 [Xiphias gladius]